MKIKKKTKKDVAEYVVFDAVRDNKGKGLSAHTLQKALKESQSEIVYDKRKASCALKDLK